MTRLENKQTIGVVFGAPDLPNFALEGVVADLLNSTSHEESNIVYNKGLQGKQPVFHVLDGTAMENGHLQGVMNSLEDHIDRVNIDEWLAPQYDLCVDEEEFLWVNVSYGRYYSLNCIVDVYFVTN